MSKAYDPNDWYWVRENGEIYASARIQTVPQADAAYQAWAADGTVPTPYPRDAAGIESPAALQAVLAPYGLFASLAEYAAAARYAAEIGGIEIGGLRFATDDRAKTMLLGARLAAQDDANYSTPWVTADGTTHVLKAADIVAISKAVLAHVGDCFRIYAEVLAALSAVPATITTRADIDAAFAA